MIFILNLNHKILSFNLEDLLFNNLFKISVSFSPLVLASNPAHVPHHHN